MTPLVSIAIAGCLAVGAGSDHITLRDLAAAWPGQEALPADRPVALAPSPGVQRTFHLPELRRLAASLGIHDEPVVELCFERRVAPLDRERILEAMRKQLPVAEVEILDWSKLPVPEGELEFALNGLRATPSGGFWSGAVNYAGGRHYMIWAKVKVLSVVTRVVAAEDLKPGHPLDASQLRVESRKEFPALNVYVASLEDAVGRTPGRSIAAGTELRSQWLIASKDVTRGETVEVDVWSGQTHLRLPAVAEASGSMGQMIPVRNPESKKRFWGQIAGKSKVSVGKERL